MNQVVPCKCVIFYSRRDHNTTCRSSDNNLTIQRQISLLTSFLVSISWCRLSLSSDELCCRSNTSAVFVGNCDLGWATASSPGTLFTSLDDDLERCPVDLELCADADLERDREAEDRDPERLLRSERSALCIRSGECERERVPVDSDDERDLSFICVASARRTSSGTFAVVFCTNSLSDSLHRKQINSRWHTSYVNESIMMVLMAHTNQTKQSLTHISTSRREHRDDHSPSQIYSHFLHAVWMPKCRTQIC